MTRFQTHTGRLAAGVAVAAILSGCAGGAPGAGGAAPARLAARSAEAGDYQTAETLYRQAFEADPNSVDALVGLGAVMPAWDSSPAPRRR